MRRPPQQLLLLLALSAAPVSSIHFPTFSVPFSNTAQSNTALPPLSSQPHAAQAPNLNTAPWSHILCQLPSGGHSLSLRGGGGPIDQAVPLLWPYTPGQTVSALRGAGDTDAMGSKMVEMALQAERNGFDLANVLKGRNTSAANSTAPPPSRKVDSKARELGQVQLEACQMVMDDCYDNAIRPLVEELENKIFAGDTSSAEHGGFAPYKKFSKEAVELIGNCRVVIDKAVKQLQAQLEVIQFASVHGGRPVSSVEFEKLKVDMRPVRHLVSEAFRELHATADRNLERLWIQHKAVIRDCYIDRFEQNFEKLIAGSSNFNRTTKALTRKTYRECEEEIKKAVPRGLGPGRTVQLEYAQDLEELKHALMAAIASRRRQSGLDDLMSYFHNIGDERRPFSRLWWKNIAIRGLILYYQICQSAWAYRKARGIPYPPRFSRPWLAAVLLPWRFAPGERENEGGGRWRGKEDPPQRGSFAGLS